MAVRGRRRLRAQPEFGVWLRLVAPDDAAIPPLDKARVVTVRSLARHQTLPGRQALARVVIAREPDRLVAFGREQGPKPHA
jgi:hypothetical protein